MSMMKDIKRIKADVKEIKDAIIGGNNMNKLEKQYKDYKFFADSRGMKMLSENGLVDEYNEFMSKCEELLFTNTSTFTIELPKPSAGLEAFKNKFNKFF